MDVPPPSMLIAMVLPASPLMVVMTSWLILSSKLKSVNILKSMIAKILHLVQLLNAKIVTVLITKNLIVVSWVWMQLNASPRAVHGAQHQNAVYLGVFGWQKALHQHHLVVTVVMAVTVVTAVTAEEAVRLHKDVKIVDTWVLLKENVLERDVSGAQHS